jgi:hypothetical protein
MAGTPVETTMCAFLTSPVARLCLPVVVFLSAATVAACQGREASPDFPKEIYPPPLPVSTEIGMIVACPNPAGVEKTAELDRDSALEVVNSFWGSRDVEAKRRLTDPAFWPLLSAGLTGNPQGPDEVDVQPANASPYAQLLASGCGDETLESTWWVESCPGPCSQAEVTSPALIGHLFLIRREGQWLLWAVY